jgi:hypothetical protein
MKHSQHKPVFYINPHQKNKNKINFSLHHHQYQINQNKLLIKKLATLLLPTHN